MMGLFERHVPASIPQDRMAAAGLDGIHERLMMLGSEPAPSADETWRGLRGRLPDRPLSPSNRLLLWIRRPAVAMLATGLLSTGVAHAAGVQPVRNGVEWFVGGIVSTLGWPDDVDESADGADDGQLDSSPSGADDGSDLPEKAAEEGFQGHGTGLDSLSPDRDRGSESGERSARGGSDSGGTEDRDGESAGENRDAGEDRDEDRDEAPDRDDDARDREEEERDDDEGDDSDPDEDGSDEVDSPDEESAELDEMDADSDIEGD